MLEKQTTADDEVGMYRVFVKGAAETVLRLCSHFVTAAPSPAAARAAADAQGRSSGSKSSKRDSEKETEISPDLCLVPLTPETAAAIEQQVIDLMAGQALRTICVAYKDFVAVKGDDSWKQMSSNPPFKRVETGLTCLAVLGIRSGF